MTLDVLIPLQAVSTFAMFGLIWLVQLVLYPAFAYIDSQRFRKFHFLHTQRITFIVGPLMCLELGTSLGIFLSQPSVLWGAGLVLTLAIWLNTFFVSVPLHNQLAVGDLKEVRTEQIERLVRTNWLRTILWTARSALVFYSFFL
jgi:hypothetical protein